MAVSLYYWNDMPNFGDRLNEDVCRFLSGTDPVWASPKRCSAAFIGSILEKFIYRRKHRTVDALWIRYFRRKVAVWGSGFIKEAESQDERSTRALAVHAVRGARSLERLRRLTGLPLEGVPLGDPGLLASRLYPRKSGSPVSCGIIPHHAELACIPRDAVTLERERESGFLLESTVKAMPLFDRLAKAVPGSVVLNPESSPEVVIGRISACSAVLSSAMHGLIVADSYGVPNMRVTASDSIMGGDYKFRDYYSAFTKDRYHVLDIRGDIPSGILESVRNGYVDPVDDVVKIQDALVASFPFSSSPS